MGALGEDAFLILGGVAGQRVGRGDRAGDGDRSRFAKRAATLGAEVIPRAGVGVARLADRGIVGDDASGGGGAALGALGYAALVRFVLRAERGFLGRDRRGLGFDLGGDRRGHAGHALGVRAGILAAFPV